MYPAYIHRFTQLLASVEVAGIFQQKQKWATPTAGCGAAQLFKCRGQAHKNCESPAAARTNLLGGGAAKRLIGPLVLPTATRMTHTHTERGDSEIFGNYASAPSLHTIIITAVATASSLLQPGPGHTAQGLEPPRLSAVDQTCIAAAAAAAQCATTTAATHVHKELWDGIRAVTAHPIRVGPWFK